MSLNLADAMVQHYAYNVMVGDDNNATMSGGYPIQRLVDNHVYVVQSGGSASKQNGYPLHLENKAVPIGLVYQKQDSNNSFEYVGGYVQSNVDAPVISNDLYNKLVSAVSEPMPHRTNGGSRKRRNTCA